AAADVLVDLDVDLAVREAAHVRLAQRRLEHRRDARRELRVRRARQEREAVVVHESFRRVRGRAGTPTHVSPGPTGEPRVTMAPAPVRAPSPTVTGATSTVPLPMNARSPTTVACLARPS